MTLYDAYMQLLNTMCGGADPAVLSLLGTVATVGTVVAVIIVPVLSVFKGLWRWKD